MGYKNTPDFIWSVAREKLFRECEFCYGLHYYTSHNGWKLTSDPLSQAAYRHKVTDSSDTYLKDCIIACIRTHFLEKKQTKKSMEAQIRLNLNKAFVDSKRNNDQWFIKPKQVDMLQEMIYTTQLDKTLVARLSNQFSSFIHHFFQSKTFNEMDISKKERIKPDKALVFNLEQHDNTTAFAPADLIYTTDNNKMVAVYFNTSDEPSDKNERSTLAIGLMKKYKVNLEDIIIREEFLLSGDSTEYSISSKDINELHSMIKDSLIHMKEKVVDNDLIENVSIPLKDFVRNTGHLEKNTSTKCPFCQFIQTDLEHFPQGLKSYQAYNFR